MKLTLIQTQLEWELPEANRQHFDAIIDAVFAPQQEGSTNQSVTDLIVLPEMFATGFSMNSRALAEPMDGASVTWMIKTAQKYQTAICGSLIIQSEGEFLNRFLVALPDGILATYDKRHLFRMSEEHENYQSGQARAIFEFGGVRFLPQVCYDLRFPVFSRNRDDYDVMLNVANWPAARRDHWLTLLKARAIENQSFVIGVNRIGLDGHGIDHAGDSVVFDARGNTLTHLESQDGYTTVSIDLKDQKHYRATFPAWKDADDFSIKGLKS